MLEKKYKTNKLYVGLIAKQSNVWLEGCGPLLFRNYRWKYENFDVGIFVEKGYGEFLRITTKTIYKLADFTTEHQIVINKSCFYKLAQQSPKLAQEMPKLTKQQILWLEEGFKKKWFEKDNQNISDDKLEK